MRLIRVRQALPRRNEKMEVVGWDAKLLLLNPSTVTMAVPADEIGKTVLHLVGDTQVLVHETTPEIHERIEEAAAVHFKMGRVYHQGLSCWHAFASATGGLVVGAFVAWAFCQVA